MSALTNNIEKRMRKGKLTQKALALKAGLNETAIRDILKGRSKDPQFSTLKAIARVFGCTIEDLYARTIKGTGSYGLADGGASNDDGEAQDAPDSLQIEEIETIAVNGAFALTDGRSKQVLRVWHIPSDVLGERLEEDYRALKIVSVHGDDMAPDFMPGDRVLVNTADTSPSPAGVFLLWDGMGFILRRCEAKPNTRPQRVVLRARNPEYGSHEVALRDVTLCGRVVCRWQKV